MLLALDHITVTLGRRTVLRDVSLGVAAGEFVGLIGPNGAGKSTLMRAALGEVPASGQTSLAALPRRQRARHVAWLPQARHIAWPITVETLVTLGRIPHRPPGARLTAADRDAVASAMAATDTAALASRPVTALSGGEQARALIARTLAQDTPLLLADEPTAGLDPAHQIAVMDVFAGLAAAGRAIVCSLHDLNLAARWCSRLVLLHEGRLMADGPPETVLTAERLRSVYGIEAAVEQRNGALRVEALARAT